VRISWEITRSVFNKSGKRGRPSIGLERMLRMYFVQQWYGLANEAVEDAIYDSQALRNFMDMDFNDKKPARRTSIVM
jgi:IS5 family transposase